jgi:hypothetical protein
MDGRTTRMKTILTLLLTHIFVYSFIYLSIAFLGWDINWLRDIGEWHPFYRFVVYFIIPIVEAFTFGVSRTILEQTIDN